MEVVQSQLFADTIDTPQSLRSHLNLLRQELHELYRDRERYADEIDELSSEIQSIQEELWNASGVYIRGKK